MYLRFIVKTWYLYQLVTQNMLRTHEGKWVISVERKNRIYDCSQTTETSSTDQTTEIALTCALISDLPSNISTMLIADLVMHEYMCSLNHTKNMCI